MVKIRINELARELEVKPNVILDMLPELGVAEKDQAGLLTPAVRALIASGIEPGDRVSIWAPNTTEWAIAALGIHTAGAVRGPRGGKQTTSDWMEIEKQRGISVTSSVSGGVMTLNIRVTVGATG